MAIAVLVAWCLIYFGIFSVIMEEVHHYYQSHPTIDPKIPEDFCCVLNSLKYFFYCGFAGLVSCSLTHTAVVPLDLIKCRLQVDSKKYQGIRKGFILTFREEGISAFGRGWAATAIGYGLQGFAKFGFYEAFKAGLLSYFASGTAYAWRTTLFLIASAFAEFIADIFLCPWEATKIRSQTLPNFPVTLDAGLSLIWKEERWRGFYKGLQPLWLRQIPYTMMKFACFERTIEFLYLYVVPKPRAECSKPEQLLITFVAGYIAGVFCAVVSHPGDSIVSVLNQHTGSSPRQAFRKLGFRGIWKGLFARIIMIGSLTALQWFLYDTAKIYLHLPRPPPMSPMSPVLKFNYDPRR